MKPLSIYTTSKLRHTVLCTYTHYQQACSPTPVGLCQQTRSVNNCDTMSTHSISPHLYIFCACVKCQQVRSKYSQLHNTYFMNAVFLVSHVCLPTHAARPAKVCMSDHFIEHLRFTWFLQPCSTASPETRNLPVMHGLA